VRNGKEINMAEIKKPVAVAPASVEKKAEPVAAEKKAEPVAAAVKKPVAKKTVAKKPAAKKTVAKKTTAAAAKKATAVKKTAAAAKKPAAAAKKPAAKKAATKKVAVKATIELQFDDRNVDVDKLAARAAKDYKKNNKADAKKIEIYVNASEKMVYYVADGVSGSFEA
jgi:hypothetical protein